MAETTPYSAPTFQEPRTGDLSQHLIALSPTQHGRRECDKNRSRGGPFGSRGQPRSHVTEHNCALFNITPAPIWKEDWTEVERFCDDMRATGVTDLRHERNTDSALLRKVIS
ncbi:MAG: hypothetical protein U9N84_01895, partial [Actinomycetota bacterium]|nr:hypothetical protein [Actinomycetota bacterium]